MRSLSRTSTMVAVADHLHLEGFRKHWSLLEGGEKKKF